MSRALDETNSIQKLVEEWTDEDIETVLGVAGSIIDDKESPKELVLLARFAMLGSLYVQARRIERGLE